MTTPENIGRDPDRAGALRGAALIVVIGAALGIGYNAMGLASRPRHGLAWIKQAEKVESLEALQAAPGAETPGGASAAPGTGEDPGAAKSAPASGEAAAATMSAPDHAKPAPAPTGQRESAPIASASGATPKRPDAPPPGKPAPDKAGVPAGTSASAQAPARPAGGTAAPAAPAAPAPSASAQTQAAASATAAANLPVIPDVTGPLKLELGTLKKLYDAGATLLVDAREAPEYAEGHISGAVSLPYNDAMAEPERVKKLDPAGRPIVVYCSGGDCELSMDLAKLMVESGKRRVLVYEGGFPEWQGAGYAVAKGPNP